MEMLQNLTGIHAAYLFYMGGSICFFVGTLLMWVFGK